MRLVFASLLAAAALSSSVLAQTSTTPPMGAPGSSTTAPSNTAGSGNPAVTSKPAGSPETTGSVEPGANSFTEDQARSRFEAQGLTNVMDLRKDDQGIWRGKAMRNGQSVSVALDYKGTIQAQ